MTHVVILGAGIAGVSAAYALKAKLGPHDEVTVVSDKPYFHFVPSNPWIAMGWRERSDIAFPIGPYLESRGIKFIHSAVRRIQPDMIQVDLDNGDTLFYDILLIATGVVGQSDAIPGLAEHTQSVIHIDQADQALAAYREFVRRPGPIVIGAAPGASVLGPLYEYAFLIDADLKRRNIRERVSITLVTPEPWPGHLGLGGEGASRGAVTAALVDTKISAICNARTTRIDKDTLHITELDAAGNDKQTHTLPFAYSMFWPAFGGVPGVRSASGLVDARGLVVVDEYLRNPDYPNVFALGACVAQPPVDKTPVPVGAPDSVYSISKAGEIVVQNILALIHDAPLTSHVPQRAKWLNDMGRDGAAYLSEPQVPLRDINWMRQGRWVHQAKIDFEKYFINKIRQQPAGQIASIVSHVAGVMNQVLTGQSRPQTLAGSGKPLEIHLQQDPCLELRALAQSVGREPAVLAAELLAAAVSDAKSCLGGDEVEAMALARRELLVADLPERQPGVEFHGGGT
ncbi:MAG TPA: FAD-dependent oxidoreductase [Thiobacillus sp.]|nr:MAG: sulfide-quinone reductase [Hydrogenophilales bacterium 28-61-11]OYZ58309.1 MAG: sulfide-quinone reductase [Hydrogenophilales bacterium 16-61-112]OZA44888.1 MAG: sulfide-quinone reductase [Hydrogenophilales bacterium 17-61-76]HQT35121.1 FAD-dependent oxidoreductase [Thiobacillus sp.]HQT70336.1 FAD-dependent oxidoreductase [Thiobacillus sp.]